LDCHRRNDQSRQAPAFDAWHARAFQMNTRALSRSTRARLPDQHARAFQMNAMIHARRRPGPQAASDPAPELP